MKKQLIVATAAFSLIASSAIAATLTTQDGSPVGTTHNSTVGVEAAAGVTADPAPAAKPAAKKTTKVVKKAAPKAAAKAKIKADAAAETAPAANAPAAAH